MLVGQLQRVRRRGLGDQIPPVEAVGFALWVGFIALFFGGLALALAPLLGRGGAAGVSAIADGPPVGRERPRRRRPARCGVSPFHWTADHIPLVGIYDWAGLALVGIVGVVFLVVGVELFQRRDLGVTAGLVPADDCRRSSWASAGRSAARSATSCRGPSRGASAWASSGALLASLVGPMADQIAAEPGPADDLPRGLPDLRPRPRPAASCSCIVALFYIAAGFAAATFVSKWASDETDGRLEMVLATPLARARWVVAGGIAALLAVVVMTALFAAGIGLGAAARRPGRRAPRSSAPRRWASTPSRSSGWASRSAGCGGPRSPPRSPRSSSWSTYLIDLLAPPLKLPDWLHQLALTAHLGQPMIGQWDVAGIVACLVIGIGGIALGAWGVTRRDIQR